MDRHPVRALTGTVASLRGSLRVNTALARGAATSGLRHVDLTLPQTWEFAGFSQNGEDGLLDVLASQLLAPNRYFVEIGASDGLENNTSWLAIACKYSGLMIDGDARLIRRGKRLLQAHNYGVEWAAIFLDQSTVAQLLDLVRYQNPDIFSLDIDGVDFHLVKSILEAGLKPKIIVVEYNSAYGPDSALTISYSSDFRLDHTTGRNLYYGCSVMGWRMYLATIGYRFVTVDSRGVNAVFALESEFDTVFLDALRGIPFAENVGQAREYSSGWRAQFGLIADQRFVEPR